MNLNPRALIVATAIGTVLQIAMVVAGHRYTAVANLFAAGGMGFSLLAGLTYAFLAGRGELRGALTGGALAGGVCAFLGILVSYLLGDVPLSLLALGTLSSVITGAIGGAIGRLVARPVPSP